MAFWIGTSGYSYPEWKGSFYPEKLAAAKMLPYYAERFSTVEINATFYRLPTAKTLAGQVILAVQVMLAVRVNACRSGECLPFG